MNARQWIPSMDGTPLRLYLSNPKTLCQIESLLISPQIGSFLIQGTIFPVRCCQVNLIINSGESEKSIIIKFEIVYLSQDLQKNLATSHFFDGNFQIFPH